MKLVRRRRTRIAFCVFNLDGMGGTSRSAITQANALAARGDHDVELLSVTRSADAPHYAVDRRVRTTYLVDVRDGRGPAVAGVAPAEATRLHRRPSVLVPRSWDWQYSALCDVALEAALPRVDADVVVTVTPALLAAAVQLLPPEAVVVHQEHRSSFSRAGGIEPLLAFAPRADVVALLTPAVADWLRERLGRVAPEIVAMPNPLPLGTAPRSPLDTGLVVAAGRIQAEKQFDHLVEAFAAIADRVPDWRLRICGDGPQRGELVAQVARLGLADRVELPGVVADMAPEWARASIVALTSKAEGFPLVLQEALAAGVPSVSYDCASGPREIVRHEVNGLLVPPDSPAAMADALLRLAGDEALRRRLGQGALSSAEEYDAHALAERWSGLFTEALARRAGRSRLSARATAGAPSPVARPAFETSGVTPAHARQAAMACAVAAARGASDDWLVAPAHDGPAPTVLVPLAARDAFLAALAESDAPAYLSVRDPAAHGWPERRGTLRELATALRRGMTPALAIEPWPRDDSGATLIGQGCTVVVEFRRGLPAGERVDADVDGVPVRTLPELLAATTTECRFPVDALLPAGEGPSTLRHALRSLHLFAPWLRRIHVVGECPDWLDADHAVVSAVGAGTVWHELPDLAEHVLLLGPGVLLGRPVRPEAFFGPAGQCAGFADTGAAPSDRVATLVREALGATPTHALAAAPRALRRSTLAEVAGRFGSGAATDPDVAPELAHHLGLAAGTAYVGTARLAAVDLAAAGVERALRRLLDRDHDAVALLGTPPAGVLEAWLERYLPVSAPWERA